MECKYDLTSLSIRLRDIARNLTSATRAGLTLRGTFLQRAHVVHTYCNSRSGCELVLRRFHTHKHFNISVDTICDVRAYNFNAIESVLKTFIANRNQGAHVQSQEATSTLARAGLLTPGRSKMMQGAVTPLLGL